MVQTTTPKVVQVVVQIYLVVMVVMMPEVHLEMYSDMVEQHLVEVLVQIGVVLMLIKVQPHKVVVLYQVLLSRSPMLSAPCQNCPKVSRTSRRRKQHKVYKCLCLPMHKQ